MIEKKRVSLIEHYLAAVDKQAKRTARPSQPRAEKIDISNETAREQKLKNDNAEQDIKLKKQTLRLLFYFLGGETGLIFIFSFFQAVGWPFGFHLDDWSFKLLVTATIAQITGMLFVAVRYLFPAK
jgi:hypothetical protein